MLLQLVGGAASWRPVPAKKTPKKKEKNSFLGPGDGDEDGKEW